MEKDDAQAVEWYTKAARQGYARAQTSLGECLLKGIGTSQSLPMAHKWFEAAAETGLPEAQYGLGCCCELEEDPEEDSSQQWDSLLQSQSPQEMIGRIKRQMLLMPDGYRAVLSLLLFEGYDYSETAQILGVEESTVRSQYLRGKRKLVEMIKNEK